MIKKSLSEVDNLKLDEISEKLHQSPAFLFAKKKGLSGTSRGQLELSSFFTLLLKIAWIDRDLTNAEVRYLRREARNWSSLDLNNVQECIDVYSDLVRRNSKFAEYIPYHIAYLGKTLDEEEKRELFEILVVISRGDLDVAKIEETYLRKVSKCLGLESKFLSETLMNAKFIASTRSEKIAIESQPDDEEVYEVPDLQFTW